jgi:hypothetical protein
MKQNEYKTQTKTNKKQTKTVVNVSIDTHNTVVTKMCKKYHAYIKLWVQHQMQYQRWDDT